MTNPENYKHEENSMWIQTWQGRAFFYDDPDNTYSTIKIADIICSLARKPRCGGHGQKALSVAEHSVITSYIVEALGGDKRAQLFGLLHDAHEAYSGDMLKPFKDYLLSVHGFDIRKVEDDIAWRIYQALKIPAPTGEALALVKQADEYALYWERKLNMRSKLKWPHTDKLNPPENWAYLFTFKNPSEAAADFRDRYVALRDKGVV